jgi:hypothetical protein
MKRNLIAIIVTTLGLAANVAVADPTVFSFTGEETQVWQKAPEATSYEADARRAMEVRPEIQEGIYSFNP